MTGGSLTTLPSAGSYGMVVGANGEGTFDMSGGTLNVVGTPAIYLTGANNSFSGGTLTATSILANSNAIWLGYPVNSAFNITGGSFTATSFGTASAAFRSWNSGSSLFLPASGGTVLNTGSGYGSGAGTTLPITANLVGSFGSFSMAGTVDATATTPAQVVIQFGSSSSPSSSNSSGQSGSSQNPSSGGSSGNGSTLSTTSTLAATGNHVPMGVIVLLFCCGGLFLLVGRRS